MYSPENNVVKIHFTLRIFSENLNISNKKKDFHDFQKTPHMEIHHCLLNNYHQVCASQGNLKNYSGVTPKSHCDSMFHGKITHE